MKLTTAALQYIVTIQKRLAEERAAANEDEASNFTRLPAKGAAQALERVLAELPTILEKVEAQAFFGDAYEDYFGQDAA